MIVVHDEHAPEDAEWARWLRVYTAGAPTLRAMIIYSVGGGPTSAQRRNLVDALGRLTKAPAAFMLTSSALARGVVTALSWFLPAAKRARTFRLDEVDRVFTLLGLDDVERKAIKQAIDKLMGALDGRVRASPSTVA